MSQSFPFVKNVRAVLRTIGLLVLVAGAALTGRAAIYTVTSTGDSGAGTLRQAITTANGTPAADTIQFNIAGGGVRTITLASPLPTVTSRLYIDGYTQPGTSKNTTRVGSDLVLLIEVSGNNSVATGLTFSASQSEVHGLVMDRFTTNSIVISSGSNGCNVQGNILGMNPAGTAASGSGNGILVSSANNMIGGMYAAQRNLISGCTTSPAVRISGGTATGNTVENNCIGLSATTSVIGGIQTGVRVESGASTNTIGADYEDYKSANWITGCTGKGIVVAGAGSQGTDLHPNYLSQNTGLDIDLNDDGVTANDANDSDSGPNGLQNSCTVVRALTDNSAAVYLEITFNSTPNRYFRFDAYATSNPNASGRGGCTTWLGTTVFTTDGSGTFNGFITVGNWNAIPTGQRINAIVTDAVTHSSSEISPNCVSTYGRLIVTNTSEVVNGNTASVNDLIATPGADGISLREAVLAGNQTLNAWMADYVFFDLPGTGPQTIDLTSPLPVLKDQFCLQGMTDPEYAGSPVVRINGSGAGAGANCFVENDGYNLFLGLSITNFSGDGIQLHGQSSNVWGCYLGVMPDGATAAGNGGAGLHLVDAKYTVTSSTEPSFDYPNVISANGQAGVIIEGGNAYNNTISHSLIGTRANGTAALGSQPVGVMLRNGTYDNIIGDGTDQTHACVISGNTQQGILGNADYNDVENCRIGTNAAGTTAVPNGDDGVSIAGKHWDVTNCVIAANGGCGIDANGDTTYVFGNHIGTNAAGTAALGNAQYGVRFTGGSGSFVGDGVPGNGNTICANGQGGVFLSGAGNGYVRGDLIGIADDGTTILANTGDGLKLNAAPGMYISGNTISGNTGHGVDLIGTDGANFINNYIGTDATGALDKGNGGEGVHVDNSSNLLLGSDIGSPNVISGNGSHGVHLVGSGTTFPQVFGNHIGLNKAGTAAIANAGDGVLIDAPVGAGRIGAQDPTLRNIISGNTGNGIFVNGSDGQDIRGNRIGTNAAGTAAVANALSGIRLENGASNNIIGGTAANEGNLISGNGDEGIKLLAIDGTTIQGNYIGTDLAGNAAVLNYSNGIGLYSCTNTLIGGGTVGARNVISGNSDPAATSDGIYFTGGGSNTVQGNYIGTSAAGTAGIPNYSAGIACDAGDNTFGGTNAGEGNLIAYNGAFGIRIGSGFVNNRILGNAIHSNTALGIDLNGDGVTANDAGDADAGANASQNFAVLASANVSGGTTTIAGTLNTTPFTNLRIEFFANAAPDASGYGEGKRFVGYTDVSTNASGNVAISTTVTGVVAGEYISSTATVFAGGSYTNTSEFSNNVLVTAGVTLAGTVFEDVNYGGGAGRDKATALGNSGTGRQNARVELFDGSGNFVSSTLTNASGDYSFTSVNAGNYTVRVVNNSVTSARTGYISGSHLGVQTFRTNASSGSAVAVTDYVGGQTPNKADAGNGTTTLAALTTATLTPQSITAVTVGASNISGIDFGFCYDVVVNTNNSGQGSFRQFITNANALSNTGLAQQGRPAGIDNAVFMISNGTAAAGLRAANNYFAGGVATITPTSSLPNVTAPVVIDAQTQPGFVATPLVEINGTGADVHSCFDVPVGGAGSVFRGLIVNRFVMEMVSSPGNNLTIQGNWIGLDRTGTLDQGNGTDATSSGIYIGGSNWLVGGTTALQRNVISGNDAFGIYVSGNGSTISGNYIGTNAAGTAAVGNSYQGIGLSNAQNNIIGGTAAGSGNLISGNAMDGVIISTACTNNTVLGNIIGLNAAGTAAIANGDDGVDIETNGNNVGDGTAAGRNIISGNTDDGIILDGADNCLIRGNYIGTNPAGTARIQNGGDGIQISNAAASNTIGGTTAGQGNLISGNGANGILIKDGGSTANNVLGNTIGTNAAGTAAVGNTQSGVYINGAPMNFIGSNTAGARNIISGNGLNGVRIELSAASSNAVQGNYIGLGADGSTAIGNTGVGVSTEGPSTTIGGGAPGAGNVISSNTGHGISILNVAHFCTIQSNTIGLTSAGSTLRANGGDGVRTVTDHNVITNNVIAGSPSNGVALVNDANQNTVTGNYIGTDVTGTLDRGNSTGIYISNSSLNTIGGAFAASRNLISGNDAIGVQVDGAAANNNTILGNYIGTTITGNAALPNSQSGVCLSGGTNANTIGGGAAGAGNVIAGNTAEGIRVTTATGNTIKGNTIGVNAAGTAALANGSGISLVSGAQGNTIGGSAAGEGNLVGGNSTDGILMTGAGTTGNIVQGNSIGTDAAGTLNVGNGQEGVQMDSGANNNTVGGTLAGQGNTIFNNGFAGTYGGVSVDDAATGNAIEANRIYNSAGLGINLVFGNVGPLANDAGDGDTGANDRQNYPLLSYALSSGGNTIIGGTLNSTASSTFRLEFFSSPTADASGNGEGAVYLGTTNVTTDASGNATFNTTLTGVSTTLGHKVSATATNAANSTSEFSGAMLVTAPVTVSGSVFEDVNYGGGAGRDKTTALGNGGSARSGARVEIYDGSGNFSSATTTDASGNYSFGGLAPGNYTVRVVNSTVSSARTGYVAGTHLAVQTFCTNASTGSAVAVTDRVGGEVPNKVDAGNGSTTLAALTTAATTAESMAPVTLSGSNIGSVDFGFSFNVVSSPANTGAGSLRQFITNANALSNTGLAIQGRTAGIDHAVFMISNGTAAAGLRSANNYFTSGVATITLASAFPDINNPVVLDAQTQPGFTTAPLIEIKGAGAGAVSGFRVITGGDATVLRGFIINGFQHDGINSGANGVTVQGNWIGLDRTGAAADGNALDGTSSGIALNANNMVIGGNTPTLRNVISGNQAYGVWMVGNNNTITGNYIGLNAAGTAAIGNLTQGMSLWNASNNTIGGATPGDRNVISGNGANGIAIGSGCSSNTLLGNYIGPAADGSTDLGNVGDGIQLLNGSTTTIGNGTAAGANVVSGNGDDGLDINVGSNGNTVRGNVFGTSASGASALANGDAGIIVEGNNNVLGGSTAGQGVVVSGNGGHGIEIRNGATGNTVLGSVIGGNIPGTAPTPNGGEGIRVAGGAANNIIGGTAAGAGNVISGGAENGILITDAGTTGNQVLGNRIGTSAGGNVANGNTKAGVRITTSAHNNVIGGAASGARNIISANATGVYVDQSVIGTSIKGNYIGTNAGGTVALGNTGFGVFVTNGSNGTLIGGAAAGEGNLISGNGGGVETNNNTFGNLIKGNIVGLNAAGTAALPNGTGISLFNSHDNTVGGNTAAERNIVSGNTGIGVQIASAGATNNTVQGNWIGVRADGTTAQGNSLDGVRITMDAADNWIGGTAAGQGNLIANNGFKGVRIDAGLSTKDRILGNAIYANGELGIDLNNDGVSANDASDPDAGANNTQNFPTIATVGVSGGAATITGTFNSLASKRYRLEFFANTAADPSGYGEGQRYLGALTVNTDASGNASFTASFSGVAVGEFISSTATEDDTTLGLLHTSEFSNAKTAGVPPTAICQNITVNLNAGGTASITGAMINSGSTDDGTIVSLTASPNTFTCAELGANSVTLTVSDNDGLSATCTATVTVADNIAPVISGCPSNITVNAGAACTATASWTVPTMSDNCSGGSITRTAGPAPGSTFPIGATTITYTATDAAGNTSTCTFTVTVVDVTAPVISGCPSNITVNAGAACTATASWTVPTMSDNCSGGSITRTAGPAPGSTFPIGATTITYTATDAAGNTSTCTFTVTVVDVTAPVISGCPSNIMVNAGAACTATASWTVPTMSDNCSGGSITRTAGPAPGSTFPIGATTIAYTATDSAGNTSTCSFTVTVVDVTAPSIACPANIVVNAAAGTCGAVVNYVAPVGTDNCSGPTTTRTAGPASGSTFPVGVTTVTYQVTDAAGNSVSCSFTVTVNDTQMPTIACPANIVVGNQAGICGAVVNYTAPLGSDNCSGVTTTRIAGPASGSTFPVGVTTVTYQATDAAGNTATCSFTVTVNDTQAPAAACQPATISLNGSGVANLTPAQVDNGSTDNCAVTGMTVAPSSFNAVGTYSVVLTVFDAAGNSNTCTTTVTVVDNNAPTAVCHDVTVVLDATGSASITGAMIDGGSTDNGTIVSLVPSQSTFDCRDIGANPVTLTVTDDGGNTDACTATVTVVDNTPPAASCHNITVSLDASGNATITGAMLDNGSTDNCGVATLSASPSAFTCAERGANTVTLTVADGSGNTSTCTATVTVQDVIAPIIACPANIVVSNQAGVCGAAVTYSTPVGSDNCSGLTVVRIAGPASGSVFPVGTTTVTHRVTDAAGNTATCSFTVTVNDVQAPSIACPVNIAVNAAAGTCGAVVSYTAPVGTDNCSGVTTTRIAGPASGSTFPVGVTTVTYQAVDAAGNTTTCSFTVTVSDAQAPSISCPSNIAVNAAAGTCGAVVNYTAPVGTDNCSGVTTVRIAGPASGSTFPVGVTTVTYQVTDGAGNTTTCSFTVTVNDTQAPVITAPANIVVGNQNGICGAVVNYTAPVGTDNCSGVTTMLTTGLASGSTFPVGTTTVTYQATDAAGNTATCSFTVTVNDTQAPAAACQPVTISLNGSGVANLTPAQVNNGSTDNCAVTSMTVAPSSFNAVGTYSVVLTVFDAAGNSSTCTTTVTVVDNNAPTAACEPATIYLDAAGQASITGMDIDAGSTDNGTIVSYVASPNTFGCAQLGANTVTLTVTDDGGNTDVCTTTVTVLDTIAPTVMCRNITVALDATGHAVITGADIDNGSADNCGITGYNASITDVDSVGSYAVTLTVTDASGNSSTCTASVVVIDTIAPQAQCANTTIYLDASGNASITAADIDGGSADNDSIVSAVALQTSFGCADLGANNVTLTVTDDGGNNAQCTAVVTVLDTIAPVVDCQAITVVLDSTGHATITGMDLDNGSVDNCGIAGYTASVTDFTAPGLYSVILTVTDASGNSSSCTASVQVSDANAPTALCRPDTVYLDANGNATIAAADIDGGSTDNGTIVSITASQTSFGCADLGTNDVTLTVTDDGGNSAQCTAVVTVLDTIAPVVECQAITVALDSMGHAVITGMDLDNGSVDNCGIASYTASVTDFTAPGLYSVMLTVTDASGNSSTCTASVQVNDTIAPTVLCRPDTIYLDASGSASITAADVDGGSTDDHGIDSLGVSQTSFDCSMLGANAVTLTAVDSAGNSAQCTTTVTVLDTIAPSVVCQPITITLDPSGHASIIGTDIDGGSTDNCGITGFSASITSFNAAGTYSVTLTVTDASGNSSSCTTSVTVVDGDQPPVALCQPATIYLDANGNAGITGADIDGGSMDDTGIASLMPSQTAFGCGDLGSNDVTLTVTDLSGNTAQCTTTVTVLDTIAPEVSCRNITISLDANGQAVITGIDIDNGSTDNCGIVLYSASVTSFNTAGTYSVELTVADASDNSSSCTATVTVVDGDTPPDAVCRPVTIYLDANGNAGITAADIDGGSTDNGTITSLAASQTSFGCGDLGANSVTLTVTDDTGNTASCTTTVTVLDTIAPEVNCASITITLDASGHATITAMDIDGGSTDNCGITGFAASVDTFNTAGTYSVTLTVTDAGGNSSSCTAMVTVQVPDDELTIPSGFSPNGDGIADTWQIKGLEDYPSNSVLIFNRWGTEIFRAAPYTNDWKGVSTAAGTLPGDLPTGTYFYVIDLGEGQGRRTGYIQLNR